MRAQICVITALLAMGQLTISCHCLALQTVANDHKQLDLVQVLESGKPLGWSGVKQLSELAPESQVIGVHLKPLDEPLSSRSDASNSVSNKTKQSQEFEINHQVSSTSTSIGLPSVSLVPQTSKPTTTSQTTTSTTATATAASQQVSSTTTNATPSSITDGWPFGTTVSAPVGSKTEREGAAVLCGEANANGKSNKKLISDRIVGGYKTEPGEFPFQVRLNIRSRRGSGICGGVVLDRYHILTAAHCMTACVSQHLTTATIETSGVKATVGDHSIKANDGEQELDVETITAHEKYDACNFYANDHDIAIIKVASPIEYKFTTDGYGSINRPCLPENRTISYQEGEQVIVSGWGVTRENSGALSNILRYVQVPIVNVTRCQETYGPRVTNDHICAGFQVGGKDSCQGDSGGPLVRVVDNRYELVGIVSFGYGCGQPGAPGVYTRVASYIDWIKANL